jgi:DNA-directed RNA polymerase specialized sigma24 family protein
VKPESVRGQLRAAECVLTDGRPKPCRVLLERVANTILTMPNRYGTLLVMRYVEGLSIEELAVATGRTHKAVKAVLYRARILARERLTRAGLDKETVLHEM